MIKDVAFFAYSVRDVPAAITFYRDVLGLRPGAMFGDHWAEFDAGTVTFGIGNGEPLGMAPGASFGAVFEVDDINAERGRLLAAGVKASEVHESPVCFSVFIEDPEGNKLGIHQRKS
jgi:predicted enzyme related to lactoylglutathione lyase